MLNSRHVPRQSRNRPGADSYSYVTEFGTNHVGEDRTPEQPSYVAGTICHRSHARVSSPNSAFHYVYTPAEAAS
jgi:hypothetical protein